MPPENFYPEVSPPPTYQPLDPDFKTTPIHTAFERTVKRHGSRLAVSDGMTSYTYMQANDRANQIAHKIISKGAQGIIGIFLDDCAEFPICLMAGLKAGCGVLLLEPKLPIERVRYMEENAGLIAVLTKEEFSDQANETFSSSVPILLLEDISDESQPGNPNLPITCNDPSILIYTSGSTGKPKGILHTHKAWMTSIGSVAQIEKFSPEDRNTQLYAPSSSASSITILFTFLTGASFHHFNLQKHSLNHFPEWVQENRISVFRSTGSTFRQVFSASPQPNKVKSIRLVIAGGEMVYQSDFDIFKQWFSQDAFMRVGGGMSEVLLMASCYLNHKSVVETKHMPMGFLLESQKVDILDSSGGILPVGKSGTVAISGPCVVDGYLNFTQESSQFKPSPYQPDEFQFISGDIGHLDENGLLYIEGRSDQMVKVRGFRVELGEIEARLLQLPGITQACVLALEGRNKVSSIIAYIVPDRNRVPAISEIRNGLAGTLPDYMFPSRYIFMDAMPLNTSGKLDRLSLPKPDSSRPVLKQPFIAPVSNLEMELAAIWRDILGLDSIGLRDDFHLLGGDSLAATQIFMMIEETLNTNLPPSILLTAPTIQKLAVEITSFRENKEAPLRILREAEEGMPTLLLFAPLFGDVIIFRDILNNLPEGFGLIGIQSWTEDKDSFSDYSINDMADYYLPMIREVLPEGPYYLGGFSLGGVIAYQTAANLLEMKEQVPIIILFDSYGPGRLESFDVKEYLKLFQQAGSLHDKTQFILRGIQKGLSRIKQTVWVKNMTTQTNQRNRIDLRLINEPYFAPELDIDLILFTSAEEKVWTHDGGELMGWQRVAKGEIHHRVLPGDHHHHFRGENAKLINEVISKRF